MNGPPPLSEIGLPSLREDLQIRRGTDGTRMIFDAMQNRHFQISDAGFQLLRFWHLENGQALADEVHAENGRQLTSDELSAFIRFLGSSMLLQELSPELVAAQKPKGIKRSQKLFGHLLMVKIPLIRPDRFLRATWPAVSVLFSKPFVALMVPLTLFGLFMVSRQWDVFVATFLHFLSPQGALIYGAALVVLKVLHELGHAYMCTRFGVRVPVIGVAFMMFFPILYTDTSDAWRLGDRRKRLMIDWGGILVELSIASLATLAWVFLPEGPWRSAAFVTATSSWIMSLLVNLNPLMRFDGYYILSDMLGVENMQQRSFAMAKWRLRELLFGLGETAPEIMPRPLRRGLIALAYGTWLYRLILFLGIALIVYAFFIKAVGVALFFGNLFFLLALPIATEFGEWWARRRQILGSPRTLISAAGFIALIAICLVPWRGQVAFPALMAAADEARIYAPRAARLSAMRAHEGEWVDAGDILFVLRDPSRDIERRRAEEDVRILRQRINRMIADRKDRSDRRILEEQLRAAIGRIEGFDRAGDQLIVRAPIDGIVRDLAPHLSVPQWVGADEQLAVIVAPGAGVVRGLVAEADLVRLAAGDVAQFVPDDAARPSVSLTVSSVAQVGVSAVEEPYFASTLGGPVAVREEEDGALRPVNAAYEVRLDIEAAGSNGDAPDSFEPGTPTHVQRGVVVAHGEARSFYEAGRAHILKVLVRESGF
ncbi:MAG: HlyD family efflux transporter periplasmic adaptor subunit [Pseudomonadota bacterium]